MKHLCIFLSLILALSCATKRKTKNIEQVEVKTENVVKNDSTYQFQSKLSKLESNQSFNEFESVLKALNIQYDGEQGNKLNVTLNRTENGTELNVSGKGKANYNEATEQTKYLTRNDVININDSLRKAELKQNKAERDQKIVDTFKSNKENDTTGIQFGAYLTGFGVLCFIILLVWIGWQFKTKNNT